MTTSVRTLALFTTYRAMHLAADEMAAGSRVCALFRTGVCEKPSRSIRYLLYTVSCSSSSCGAMEQESSEDLYQISLLIDQLKHDDVTLRANAYKDLQRIGK